MLDLMQTIEALTTDIITQLTNDVMNTAESLLAQRQQLMSELISLHATGTDIVNVRDFVAMIHERDQSVMAMLKNEREHIKDALSKLNKVKQYVTV